MKIIKIMHKKIYIIYISPVKFLHTSRSTHPDLPYGGCFRFHLLVGGNNTTAKYFRFHLVVGLLHLVFKVYFLHFFLKMFYLIF